jgi:hypothetical protein
MALLPALHGAQRKIKGRGELFLRHSEALAKGLNVRPGDHTQRPQDSLVHAVVLLLALDVVLGRCLEFRKVNPAATTADLLLGSLHSLHNIRPFRFCSRARR